MDLTLMKNIKVMKPVKWFSLTALLSHLTFWFYGQYSHRFSDNALR